ncbi:MAG TPA: hypothetical protein VM184_09115 [Gaiellaceae bacterium]|nr:hypothetical protein [Gaiellaceae bacterium]
MEHDVRVAEDPLDVALREIVAARAALDSLEATLVVRARSYGRSWSELAAPLGVTKQAARSRHVARDPVAARRRAEREQDLGWGPDEWYVL